jgi:predicted nucleic acid-binding protein
VSAHSATNGTDRPGMKLYFDANVLIRAVEGDDAAAKKICAILDLAQDGGCRIFTSDLSIAETMVGPLKALVASPKDGEAAACERLYRSFVTGHEGVTMLAVDRDILLVAAKLRARRPSTKLPDAIHLATDIAAKCDVFVSGDKRLLAVAEATSGRSGSVCSIEPHELGALNHRLGL